MQSRKTMMVTLCAGFAVALGCATALRAADNGAGDEMKLPKVSRSALVDDTLYSGYGEIEILADGILLVSVREMLTVDNGDESDQVEFLETSAYGLDTTRLSLVQHGNEVFLDQDGLQLERRGLTADEVSLVLFEGAGRAPSTNGNDVLDSFSGDMNLRSGRRSDSVFISVLDDKTGRLFTVTLGGSTGGARGDDSEKQESNCSIVTCPKGSQSITCIGEGCFCRCKKGRPDCHCIESTSVG